LKQFIERGHALAEKMSWDVVARDYVHARNSARRPGQSAEADRLIYVFAVDSVGIDWRDVDVTDLDTQDPDLFYVIHAMELSDRDKRRYRRRRQ
jgi:hypothetical protein